MENASSAEIELREKHVKSCEAGTPSPARVAGDCHLGRGGSSAPTLSLHAAAPRN
jgi:hypothetical protein